MTDQNIEYEGDGPVDNRRNELLPDSWNFFVFIPKKAKSVIGKVWESLAKYMQKSETKESIAEQFANIVFDSTLENVVPGNKSSCCINVFRKS
jgi:predicted sugar kinase